MRTPAGSRRATREGATLKIFISSVRRGLEAERDSLPGLLRAVGHEPLRFEDFTAQSVPSREACLAGVQEADAYVLLLGRHYGSVFPETGWSPTHEEYVAAQAKGIPRLVFCKKGVELESDQATFVAEIESYSTGIFRDSFEGAVDLQAKVVAALNQLPAGPLDWHRLADPSTFAGGRRGEERNLTASAELCVHVVPVDSAPIPRRQIAELPEHLAQRARALQFVPASAAIDVGVDDSGAYALLLDHERRGWRDADHGGLTGYRIESTGQRPAIERLPRVSMGVLLDARDLTERVARNLRLLGTVAPLESSLHAIALEMHSTAMAVVGSISQLGNRSSASGLSTSGEPILIEPDEAVTAAAFDRGALEAARPIVDQLLDAFARRR